MGSVSGEDSVQRFAERTSRLRSTAETGQVQRAANDVRICHEGQSSALQGQSRANAYRQIKPSHRHAEFFSCFYI